MPSAAQLAGGLAGLRRMAIDDAGETKTKKEAKNLPGAKLAGGMSISLDMLQGVKLKEKRKSETPETKSITPERDTARQKTPRSSKIVLSLKPRPRRAHFSGDGRCRFAHRATRDAQSYCPP